MEPLGEVLREHRQRVGLSQADLAEAAGIHLRQIRRYESGEQQPVLSVAVRLADALGLTMNELTSRSGGHLNLTGRWWAGWQTFTHGDEVLATQPVEMEQHGLTVSIRALERSEENVRGAYVWTGELRVWDNQILMGWYTAVEENVRSRGTLFFVLHTQGGFMEGSWTGMSYVGPIVSGWAAIAHARDEVASVLERLRDRGASTVL
jgi:transcriptional regulator with XRE-family HTH domain